MPNATDDILLALAPGLAKPQIVEVKIKLATDGEYEFQLEDLLSSGTVDPIIHVAAGETVEQIRDALFSPIVSPAYDPYKAKKYITDRFRVTGPPGDPFEFWLVAPGGTANATAIKIQSASGASTATRLLMLQIAAILIWDTVVWKDKVTIAQAWLAAFLSKNSVYADQAMKSLGIGGQASSLSLGPASVSLAGGVLEAMTGGLEGDAAYGIPFLLLMRSATFGPLWSR